MTANVYQALSHLLPGPLPRALALSRGEANPGARRKGRPVPPVVSGLLALGFLGVFLAGCGKDHAMKDVLNPSDPGVSGVTPPVAKRLAASVGNRSVALSWELDDSTHASSVRRYRIYRRAFNEDTVLIDSVGIPPAPVTGLVNGVTLRFSVSAVLNNGLEGKRSEEISATPGVFGLQIEGGRERFSSNQVRLTLLAPDGTRGMQLANTEDLSDAPVQPFVSQQAWLLVPGDGPKEVFARFLDAEGNSSVEVSDAVLVDSRAEIREVRFNPTSLGPGQTLHIEVDGMEPHGTAAVVLGSGGRRINLRDDGSGGDAAADDGVYSFDYIVEEDVNVVDGLVAGSFTDEAGNQAPTRIAPYLLTVRRDPSTVTLAPILSPGPRELFLSWTQATDAVRFSAYRIFRTEAPGVDTSSTRRQIHEATVRDQTTFTDTNLDPDRTYYYRVYVFDPNGFSSPSNEESGQPRRNPPPEPVVLQTPSNVTETSVTLAFSQSLSPVFAQYRIYRGERTDLDHDPARRLLTTLTSASQTTYEDRTALEEHKTYSYRVDVVDAVGTASPSNVVSVTIPDKPPHAVTLNTPSSVGETAVLLGWTRNDDLDFSRYEVRRSGQAGVSASSTLRDTLGDAGEIGFLDSGLIENTDYYYRVFVVDKGGNVAGSNELKVTSANDDPRAVTLYSPGEVFGAFTSTDTLRWSISTAHDFQEYRLYRDTAPDVGESSTLVRTVADSNVVTFSDAGLTDNTRYYYRVFVHDNAGGTAGSNEQSIVMANRPPEPVTLTVTGTTNTSISLSWTQCPSHDFDEYRLLKGRNSTSITELVVSFLQRGQTGHTLFLDQADSTRYFFKVVSYDQALETGPRLSTDSNVVSGRITPP